MRQIEGKHLRSAYEILGYHIEANDDSFGHAKDVVIQEENSGLQYLAIDTKTWLPVRSSLIDIEWVEGFDWRNKTARVGMLIKQIEMAPRFDPFDPVNEDKHQKLYDYYGKPRNMKPLQLLCFSRDGMVGVLNTPWAFQARAFALR